MRSPRDRLVVQLLGGLALVAGCSRLTSVDWSRIPPNSGSNEGGAGATDSGGAAGEPAGGSSLSGGAGEAGEAGAPGGGEGGEGGEAGSDSGGSSSGSGGSSGFGGFGGFGGMSGGGGTSGGGAGGSSGTGGTGGGVSDEPDPCTGTTSPVVAADLVLFDGGQGKPNTARGGRAGLDAACVAALAKLSLPQTATHAFITVDAVTDSINLWTNALYPEISKTARVVGPTGIQLAPSFSDLIKGPLQQSLACAAVTSASDRTWLTGGSSCSSIEPVGCFVAGDGRDNCNGWTVGDYQPEVQARYGYTIFKDLRWAQGDAGTSPFAKIACNAATDNVLCLAYTP
jgi:hypothetical protein